MSKERVVKDDKGTPSSFWNNVKNLPNSSHRKMAMFIIILIPVLLIILPLGIMFAITGSFSTIGKPIVNNPNLYIGSYQVQIKIYNETDGTYYPVNGTVQTFDYYNETSLANITADGITVYTVSNVTFGCVMSIDSQNGKNYSIDTFLVRANTTAPQLNVLYLKPFGNSSDFSATITRLDNVEGTFTVANFVSTTVNFTLNMTSINSNVSIGERHYIPSTLRTNENCSFTALWLYMNCFPTEVMVTTNNFEYIQNMYCNATGTFLALPSSFSLANSVAWNFTLTDCNVIPTEFKFIDGQFDGFQMGSL